MAQQQAVLYKSENMDAPPRVSIIVLNWNGWQDTIECLESLWKIEYPNYDIIVTDNGSKDDSVKRILEYCQGKREVTSLFFRYDVANKPMTVFEDAGDSTSTPDKFDGVHATSSSCKNLILIKNSKNYGFSGGNNVAIRLSLKVLEPDYILLLNNDTVVERSFLSELVEITESDRTIGIAGPKTYFYDFNGRSDVINFAGGRFNTWTGIATHIGVKQGDNGQYDSIRDVNYVEGSCLLVKRQTIEEIGLLNPCLFLWDDIEWCRRAQKNGWRCVYVPQSKIWHKVGASLGDMFSPTYLYHFARSALLFLHGIEWYRKPVFTSFLLAQLIYKTGSIVRRTRKLSSFLTCLQIICRAFVESKRMAALRHPP